MGRMADRNSSRNGAEVRWIALHTSEGTDKPNVDDAVGLRDATWWTDSCHAISDDVRLLDENSGCVDPARAAWTLRNGNPKSVNIEQIGYAGRSRDEWLHSWMGTLRNTARWVARMSQLFNIPLKYIGTQGVRNNEKGIIQHNDYSQGTGDGSHWDCGPGYPTDVVLELAKNVQAGHGAVLNSEIVVIPPTPTLPPPEVEVATLEWTTTPKAEKDAFLSAVRDNSVENASGPTPGGTENNVKDVIWRMARMETTVNKLAGLPPPLTPEQITAIVNAAVLAAMPNPQ